MADINELRAARRKKVRAFQELGDNPYPETTPKRYNIADVLSAFNKLKRDKKSVTVAGRILGLRTHGGATFLDIKDVSGNMQALVSKRIVGPMAYSKIPLYDMGDIVAVSGLCIKTRRGESSIEVKRLRILSKSLRPLPDAWYGLSDVEERFRDREVDFIMNKEAQKRIVARGKLLSSLRSTLMDVDFLEVETPILQSIPGGAMAKPFKTKLNALNIPLYLRIAPELYLKRLIVGGFERVYEIGRVFRNEGMDATHNPEFSELEFYWAYQDFEGLLKFTERLLRMATKGVTGSTTIIYQGKKVLFGKALPRIEYCSAFKKAIGVDPIEANDKKLQSKAKQFNVSTKGVVRTQLIDHLFKKVAAPTLPQPCFLIHHPLELSPLSKASEKNSKLARRMQVVAGGFEIVNAYAELNDPDEQSLRFRAEATKRRAGDYEAHPLDDDFIRALEYGMPPTAGFGLGIDRFLMLLTDTTSIREVIAFPTMRPKKRD